MAQKRIDACGDDRSRPKAKCGSNNERVEKAKEKDPFFRKERERENEGIKIRKQIF